MPWDIKCTERRFFVGGVFSTKICILSPDERVLIASCYFTGIYLKRDSLVPFLETEKVILGVNTQQIDSAGFSLFLSKDIPPSYSGANIAVVYSLNIHVQGSRSNYTSTVMCSVISGVPVCFESSSKIAVSEKYESIEDKAERKSTIVETSAEDRIYCYQKIVDTLRNMCIGKVEHTEFTVESDKTEKTEEDPLKELSGLARSFLLGEKESNQHPLHLYAKISKDGAYASPRQAIYSITSQGVEYAKALLSYTEEDPPYCLLSLCIDVLEPIELVQISLVQVETVDEIEERSVFFSDSKNIRHAKKVLFEIPLNRARNPTIVTPRFNTQVELKIDINSTHTARIRIK